MKFGLLETGFKRKTFEDMMNEITNKQIETYGAINTDPEDPLMQNNSIFVKQADELWQGLEYLYNAMYPDTATGVSLDYICNYIGASRLQATKTKTKAKLTGLNQILIPVNSQIGGNNIETVFTLDNDLTLTNEACFDCLISIASQMYNEYSVYINAEEFKYIKQAQDNDQQIIDGLVALINASNQMIEAENQNNKLYIKTTDPEIELIVYLSAGFAFDLISRSGNFTALNSGRITIALNSLTIIKTPIAGWNSVINEFEPRIGRNLETDAELRMRRELSLSLNGFGTINAIRAKLLNLPGVIAVSVIENATKETVNNLPPKSFECLVTGGDDQTIAQTIWDAKGGGIETYGAISMTVKDSEGSDQIIKFSRPVYVYVYADITLVKDNDVFPMNGDDLIKTKIVDQITKLGVGYDVLYQSLYASVYSIPGVSGANIVVGGSLTENKPALSSNNIIIDRTQIVKTDLTKITIL